MTNPENDEKKHRERTPEHLGDPPSDYDPLEVQEAILGRESAFCELCNSRVTPKGLDWFHVQIDPLDYSTDNHAVICRDCVTDPEIDHIERARELRAQNRRPNFPDTPRGRVHESVHRLERWLTEQAAPLFWRRLLTVVGAAVVGIVALVIAAGVFGAIFVDPQTGADWVVGIITGTSDVLRGAIKPSRLWLLSIVLALGYTAHCVERERNDRTGTRTQWEPMWFVVGLSGVVGVVAAIFVGLGRAGLPILIEPLAAAVYLLAGAVSAYAIERARKCDDAYFIWHQSRYHWTLPIRLGALLGATIILAPPATVLPVWSPALTMSLLALGPVVAVAYAVGRTYAADRVGQTARDALDQVWSFARKFPVTRSQTTPNPTINNGENQ
ncbi:hypothetical protein [Haladaptatus sp. CMAA 1911]|uniref:hypothetical protein n=1 Tax=unclassified Haladaptatus TaxID=2622732 RepID=UPI003754F9CC